MNGPYETSTGRGDFVSLKTHNFKSTLDSYRAQVAAFETILTSADKTINNLLGSWTGRGRDAFRSDVNFLGRCFEDLHDNMRILEHTLINSEEAYMAADSDASR